VPFLTWQRTYAPQAGRGPVPTLAQLAWPAAEASAYGALTLGVVGLAGGVAAASPAAIRAAGGLLVVGALAFVAALGHVLSHRAPRASSRPAATPRVATP
jgi:hypothetical protein